MNFNKLCCNLCYTCIDCLTKAFDLVLLLTFFYFVAYLVALPGFIISDTGRYAEAEHALSNCTANYEASCTAEVIKNCIFDAIFDEMDEIYVNGKLFKILYKYCKKHAALCFKYERECQMYRKELTLLNSSLSLEYELLRIMLCFVVGYGALEIKKKLKKYNEEQNAEPVVDLETPLLKEEIQQQEPVN